MNHDNAHCSDYIKREDAIEQARRNWTGEDDWIASTEINLLKNLPPADVRENVRGEWLDYWDNPIKFYFDGRYSAHCSVCGYHPEYEEEMHSANFCPNCGADMRPYNEP